MNFRSSIAERSVGLVMATVNIRPTRLSGSTRCLWATSAETSLMIFGSTLTLSRSTAGTRYWRANMRVSSSSATNPSFTRE